MIRRTCIIAAAIVLRPHLSSAVTIREYYIDGQIATDPNFTTGLQNIDLSGIAPTVNVPIGDYFQFGVSLVLTGNPNPAAGDAWDLANQAAGNPPQPANLGISQVRFDVPSTDASTYSLAPLLGPLNPNFAPNSGIHDSTAMINPDQSFDFRSPGAVEGGGIVNINVANDENFDVRTPAVAQVGYFSGTSSTADQATPFFTNLAFQGQAAGSVQLSPGIEGNQTFGFDLSYWTSQTPGSVAANGTLKPATYSFQRSTDVSPISSNPLPLLTVNVTPIQPILSLELILASQHIRKQCPANQSAAD